MTAARDGVPSFPRFSCGLPRDGQAQPSRDKNAGLMLTTAAAFRLHSLDVTRHTLFPRFLTALDRQQGATGATMALWHCPWSPAPIVSTSGNVQQLRDGYEMSGEQLQGTPHCAPEHPNILRFLFHLPPTRHPRIREIAIPVSNEVCESCSPEIRCVRLPSLAWTSLHGELAYPAVCAP